MSAGPSGPATRPRDDARTHGSSRRTDAASPHETRRSFRLGVWNGTLYQAGEGFIDASTVIPLLLSRLTASGALIGLGASLSDLGWLLPQFIATPWAARQPRQLPIYRRAAVVRGAALLLLAALAFPLYSHPKALMLALFLCYGVYCFGAGASAVSFMDVVGRTIPRERLGTFWSMRLFYGGALAALAGVAVREILRMRSEPMQYLLLFGLAAILASVAYGLFGAIHEPSGPPGRAPATALAHLAEGLSWWRGDPHFRHLLLARATLACWLTVSPFVVLFAFDKLGSGARSAGTFLTCRLAGFVLSNLAWGELSKRYGARAPLVAGAIGTAVVSLLAALVAWASPWSLGILSRTQALLALEALVFLGGAAQSGFLVGFGSLLLGLAPHGRRIEFVSLTNTFLAPSMILPALGGALVDRINAPVVFALCGILSLWGLRAALKLPSARVVEADADGDDPAARDPKGAADPAAASSTGRGVS